MSKRIPEEIREEIIRLYNNGQGLSPAKIAREVNVPYYLVYNLTRMKQKMNPETGRAFASFTEYQKYRAKQKMNPETGQLFASYTEYLSYHAKKRVNPETGQLFASYSEYKNYHAKKRVNQSKNQGLSKLIQKRLKEMGRSQSWLAGEIGVTRASVSLYALGRSVPGKDILEKLFSSLKVPYQTLDDILNDTDS